ncbi:CHAT domain-containing protein [Caballeronia sordidicola]|uniref:CHAT domain-containing protein n=1 Tax=Caballeronia sordidicola TaxID=196367 RepID=UPI0004D01AAB|nr:CHAT domain-containing protein [Caballeronia sordidicola]
MNILVLDIDSFVDLTRWRWVLRDAHGQFLGDHEVRLDPRVAEYEGFLDLAQYVWRRASPDRPEEEAAELGAFGDWLSDNLFGTLTRIMRDYAPVTVRVVVPRAAEALVLRPLEATTIEGVPLTLANIALVFEVLDDPIAPRGEGTGAAVRILAVFSLPPEECPLNLREERQALRRMVSELEGGARHAAIELRTLQYGATRETLRDALDEGEGWDIVHFSGHGMPGQLSLESTNGSRDVVDAEELAQILRENRTRLKLVTVSACHSGAGSLAALLAAIGIDPQTIGLDIRDEASSATPPIARALASALDCAVVAMRFPVEDQFAIGFADTLYRQLLNKHVCLPQAFQRAVKAAANAPQTSPLSAVTPALFGRQSVDLRLALPKVTRMTFAPAETGTFNFPSEPNRFVGRVALMTRASAALAFSSGKVGVLFHGMAGAGKSACAVELAYHMRQTARFKAWVWFEAPDRERDTATALRDLAMAMESQLPDFKMLHVVGRQVDFAKWLPRFKALLAQQAVLVVLDNIESLLTNEGQWRDPQFGQFVEALLAHSGLSRVILTSQTRPALLPAALLVEPVHSLSLAEAALLMSRPSRLYRFFNGNAAERALARRLLNVVQGHPTLIKLAEGLATDTSALAAQIKHTEAVWRADGSPIDAFFHYGESQVSDRGFISALADWTDRAVAALPPASRAFLQILCVIEADDRTDSVLNAVWGSLAAAIEMPALPDLPDDDLCAPVLRAGLIARTAEADVVGWSIHPAITAREVATTNPALRRSVDETLAGFWSSAYQWSQTAETQGAGKLLVRSGISAAPYLLRLGNWGAASAYLEHVLLRDDSSATAAAVLPWLRKIAGATSGTAEELYDRAKLARALRSIGQNAEAEEEMRQVLAAAVDRGQFRVASAVAGDLTNWITLAGTLDDALAMADRKIAYSKAAGLGPWTQLADEGKRLVVKSAKGRFQEVLNTVLLLQERLAGLPEAGENETAIPWNVRETLLDIGRSASLQLRQWDRALQLNEQIKKSQAERNAGDLQQAKIEFNDYQPLIELQSYGDVRKLINRCRRTFEREDDIDGLAAIFSATASLEHALHGPGAAIPFEERALRYHYRAGMPGTCALSHYNLSNYILWGHGAPIRSIAHRLAAITIGLLTQSNMLKTGFNAFVVEILSLGAKAREAMPTTFADLCTTVQAIEGVYFDTLIQSLNTEGANLDNLVLALVEQGFKLAEGTTGLG